MRTLLLAAVAIAGATWPCSAAIDSGLLSLVPAGTQGLAGVNLAQGKASALGQYLLLRAGQEQPQLQKLIDSTGFDPRRDLEQVLIATQAAPNEAAEPQAAVVLARGTFDIAKMKQAFAAQGGSLQTVAGLDVFVGKGGQQQGVAFLDSTLAIAGNLALVRSAVTNRNQQSTVDPALLAKANAVSSTNEAWFASVVPPSRFGFHAPSGEKTNPGRVALQSILQSSGGLHFGPSSVDASFDATTRTDEDAKSLADVVRFVASMVQMQRQSGGAVSLLAPALDQMQITTGTSAIHVALSVPENTVEQLINQPHPRRQALARKR